MVNRHVHFASTALSRGRARAATRRTGAAAWRWALAYGIAFTQGLMACSAAQEGNKTMVVELKSSPLHTAPELLALWQFNGGGQSLVGLLERNAAATRTTFLVGHVGQGRLGTLRKIDNEDVSIRAADAQLIGDELFFVLEINRGWPLQTARVKLPALLDAQAPPLAFADQRELRLRPAQAAQVKLPVADLWNVADRLPPRQWLFNPRLVTGTGAAIQVVANTADGQAVTLGAAGQDVAMTALPDAAEPQALQASGRLHRVYFRGAVRYRPFSSLPRYTSGVETGTRQLLASLDVENVATDLSAAFGLGAVRAFALAAGAGGQPWLFAMHRGQAGPEIAVLAHVQERWTRIAALAVDVPGDMLSAQLIGDAWQLVWAERGAESTSVRHAIWRR